MRFHIKSILKGHINHSLVTINSHKFWNFEQVIANRLDVCSPRGKIYVKTNNFIYMRITDNLPARNFKMSELGGGPNSYGGLKFYMFSWYVSVLRYRKITLARDFY